MSTTIQIFKNGDANGQTLAFAKDTSIEQLCEAASQKLSVSAGDEKQETVAFGRVFLADGAELTGTEDILENDSLYFAAAGEAFQAPVAAVATNHVLEGLVKKSIPLATDLYAHSSAFVKSKSPEFVNKAIERVEGQVQQLAAPLVTKAFAYGTPAVTWADQQIDSVFTRFKTAQVAFMESEMAKQLNDVLTARILKPSELLFSYLVSQYRLLHARAIDSTVQVKDLVAAMRERLGSDWDEKLRTPVLTFYEAVATELQKLSQYTPADALPQMRAQMEAAFVNVRARLEKAWEQEIEPFMQNKRAQLTLAFDQKLRSPAEAFYQSAMENYEKLRASSEHKTVSWEEFQIGMRSKLGKLWNSDMAKPARHVYESLASSLKPKTPVKVK